MDLYQANSFGENIKSWPTIIARVIKIGLKYFLDAVETGKILTDNSEIEI